MIWGGTGVSGAADGNGHTPLSHSITFVRGWRAEGVTQTTAEQGKKVAPRALRARLPRADRRTGPCALRELCLHVGCACLAIFVFLVVIGGRQSWWCGHGGE